MIDPAVLVGSLGLAAMAASTVLYFSNFRDQCAQCEHCRREKRARDEAKRESHHQWLHQSFPYTKEDCPLCKK